MTYNILLTGVGGEGVLVTSVIVARAANMDGYEVRGTQLHGLAQRGGSIPTHLRLGKKVYSPIIPRASADLILGLEPIEAARACFHGGKDRTNFIVDTYPLKPVYANLLGQTYPSNEKVRKMIEPFAKKIIMVDASNICYEKLGNPIFGNVMCIGVALANDMLPISKKHILKSLKEVVPRGLEKNLKAFKMGLDFKG
ncbi:MAG: indolepyruvate ferredoxin oxidoreductase [Candidatus Aenigmarchaeota archaeon]|nr:indolepyruvate ferredoxin oxidoreductase [Candidatus Aenigmarchaeota archaeon]NIQ18007.1 indolepyruvate ferredoxin oxidoreductase [Candidatus Aenigmarchaeota archaeon]